MAIGQKDAALGKRLVMADGRGGAGFRDDRKPIAAGRFETRVDGDREPRVGQVERAGNHQLVIAGANRQSVDPRRVATQADAADRQDSSVDRGAGANRVELASGVGDCPGAVQSDGVNPIARRDNAPNGVAVRAVPDGGNSRSGDGAIQAERARPASVVDNQFRAELNVARPARRAALSGHGQGTVSADPLADNQDSRGKRQPAPVQDFDARRVGAIRHSQRGRIAQRDRGVAAQRCRAGIHVLAVQDQFAGRRRNVSGETVGNSREPRQAASLLFNATLATDRGDHEQRVGGGILVVERERVTAETDAGEKRQRRLWTVGETLVGGERDREIDHGSHATVADAASQRGRIATKRVAIAIHSQRIEHGASRKIIRVRFSKDGAGGEQEDRVGGGRQIPNPIRSGCPAIVGARNAGAVGRSIPDGGRHARERDIIAVARRVVDLKGLFAHDDQAALREAAELAFDPVHAIVVDQEEAIAQRQSGVIADSQLEVSRDRDHANDAQQVMAAGDTRSGAAMDLRVKIPERGAADLQRTDVERGARINVLETALRHRDAAIAGNVYSHNIDDRREQAIDLDRLKQGRTVGCHRSGRLDPGVLQQQIVFAQSDATEFRTVMRTQSLDLD